MGIGDSGSESATGKSKRQPKQPKFQRSVAYVPADAIDTATARLDELVTNRLTLQTAVSKLYDRIKGSLEQGISYEDLAKALTASGIQITVTRLKQSLAAESKARGVSRRRSTASLSRAVADQSAAASMSEQISSILDGALSGSDEDESDMEDATPAKRGRGRTKSATATPTRGKGRPKTSTAAKATKSASTRGTTKRTPGRKPRSAAD